MTKDEAATKIQAVYRGNADRIKVVEHSKSLDDLLAKVEKQEISVSAAKKLKEAQAPKYWTQSNKFSLTIGFVVLLNSVALGVEADYGHLYVDAFFVIENIFCAVFTLELLVHFFVEGPRIYFADKMNWLDCSLVLLSVVDVWIIRPIGIEADLRILSVLRMLRLVRLARLLKLVKMFRELTLIVSGFVDAAKTLIWAILFLLSVLYVFALVARQMIGNAVSPDCGDDENCTTERFRLNPEIGSQKLLFGAVDRSMLTLFVCLTEGCGIDIVHPLTLEMPILFVFWVLFIFSATYGLLNLIIGCFCEQAIKNAQENEREMLKSRDSQRKQTLSHMKVAFERMDKDGSGMINRDEYHNSITKNQEVADAFVELGLDEEEDLFDTLDAEGEGAISFDQFFEGVMLIMKGHETAKAKDMVPMYLTCQAIFTRMKTLDGDLSTISDQQAAMLEHLRSVRKFLQGGESPIPPSKIKSPKNASPRSPRAGAGTAKASQEKSYAVSSSTVAVKSTQGSVPTSLSPGKGSAPFASTTNNASQPSNVSFPGPPGATLTPGFGSNAGQQCTDVEISSMIRWLLETAETFCNRLNHVEESLGKQKQQLQMLCAAKAA